MTTLASARESSFEVPPSRDDQRQIGTILVWFEGTADGRAALAQAQRLATRRGAKLVVLTVAARERVVGCGRCLQGTVLWNIEMEKIAAEELTEARQILGGATPASYQSLVGSPAELISDAAARMGAHVVVIPRQRNRRLDPPNRRNIAQKLAAGGSWEVIGAEGARGAASGRGRG
jgi:nucleotide-binding universal stress UspA family protein